MFVEPITSQKRYPSCQVQHRLKTQVPLSLYHSICSMILVSVHIMYIYLFMYLFIYLYLFICLFICLYIYCIYLFICLFVYLFIHLFTYLLIYLFIYTYMYIYIYQYLHIYIYIYTYIWVIFGVNVGKYSSTMEHVRDNKCYKSQTCGRNKDLSGFVECLGG